MRILKKIISAIGRGGISIVLLVFLLRQVDTKNVLEIISHADKLLLLYAFLVLFFGYALGLYRWQQLLKGAKIDLPLRRVITSFAGGMFFSVFLPSSIGGDLVRSIDLAAHTKKTKEVVATVILDRLSGYIGLVFIVLLALLCGFRFVHDPGVIISIAVITMVLVVVVLILFNTFLFNKINKLLHSPTAGKMRDALKNLHQEIHVFKHQKRIIANNLLVSVVIQTVTPIGFYITALALGVKVNIIYFFIFLPIITAITLLPISIGGLGIREYTSKLFFAKAGVDAGSAFAMSLLNSLFILIYAAIGGLIYVMAVGRKGRKSSA
jgi:uncharacterized protein (TIRG00374 family)